jgi:FHA domain
VSDTVLGILKIGWLVLLYLFVLRVVLVVAKELKGTPVTAGPGAVVAAPEPKRSQPQDNARWHLLVHQPEALRGTTVALVQEITIGRGGGCAIALAGDTFVSTVHARVAPRGNDIWIEDLASTNGTFVNASQIDGPQKLKRGDRITIGSSEIEVTR